jgi:hypothetical protein
MLSRPLPKRLITFPAYSLPPPVPSTKIRRILRFSLPSIPSVQIKSTRITPSRSILHDLLSSSFPIALQSVTQKNRSYKNFKKISGEGTAHAGGPPGQGPGGSPLGVLVLRRRNTLHIGHMVADVQRQPSDTERPRRQLRERNIASVTYRDISTD